MVILADMSSNIVDVKFVIPADMSANMVGFLIRDKLIEPLMSLSILFFNLYFYFDEMSDDIQKNVVKTTNKHSQNVH